MAAFQNGGPPPISDGTPMPRSVADVEMLVKRLYQPSTPSLVSSIEKHLQWHQRSPDGWDMAATLYQSSDLNVRFFGALTFTVKLNTAGKDLDDETANVLSQRLIAWYTNGFRDAGMVSQKMASNLAILYLQPEAPAKDCIARLAASLAYGSDNVSATVSELPPLSDTLPRLDTERLLALLVFTTYMPEEGSKRINSVDRPLAAIYQDHVLQNTSDAVEVMRYCLTNIKDEQQDIRAQAVNCLVTWAVCCQKSSSIDPKNLKQLRSLIHPTVFFISETYDSDEENAQQCIEYLSDLLTHYASFFHDVHLQNVSELLRGPVGEKCLLYLKQGEGFAMPFARLLCAYADADLPRIAEGDDDIAAQHILEMMHQLLCCDGFAGVDDEAIIEVQGLWNSFVEFVVDSQYDGDTGAAPSWQSYAKGHIVRMVGEFWAKIQYPSTAIYREWTDEDKKAFQQFRSDVRDLFITSHLALKTELLRALVDMSLSSLSERNWTQLEAALYSLYGVAESLDESAEEDALISRVTTSSLYPDLANTDSTIPQHVRRTAMKLIGSLGSYYERRPESLPHALNFLFTALESDSMAEAAAKSIYNLCTGCRDSLKAELGAFFQQYQRFLSSSTANIHTKPKIIGAVAAIVQTISEIGAKREALLRLLEFVEANVKTALQYMAAGNYVDSQSEAACAMVCLASVARASQETIEVVDLDSSPTTHSYWTDGDGAAVQQRIIPMMSSVLTILPSDRDVLECVCDTLKCGFTESAPGPFVLSPSVVASFLARMHEDMHQLCIVLNTTCGFIRAYTPPTTPSISSEVDSLLIRVVSIIHTLESPRNDPEVAQALVDVLTRYYPRYTESVVRLQPPSALEAIINFTIACVRAPEPLPKRSAANFWAVFLTLTGQEPALQGILDEIVSHFGPKLALVFVAELGGNTMRSDIEMLADPVKRFLSRSPRSRAWLESALSINPEVAAKENDIGLQTVASLQPAVKSKFLASLFVAKDMNTLRKVLHEFNQACKMSALRSSNSWQGAIVVE